MKQDHLNLIQQINIYAKEADVLEPNALVRKKANQAVFDYADTFLNQLAAMPGISRGRRQRFISLYLVL